MRTEKKSNADVGDIIISEKFAYGYYDSEFDESGYLNLVKGKVTVDGKTRRHQVHFSNPETPRNKPAEYKVLETGAYDKSRAKAKFVVEKAHMQGGGTGHGQYDIYPDGWHIEARRLNEDGSYNPDGELISFYQTGCFTCLIPEVKKVGKINF